MNGMIVIGCSTRIITKSKRFSILWRFSEIGLKVIIDLDWIMVGSVKT